MKKGFTLIELLVTIAIIVLITVFVFVNYGSFLTRSTLITRTAEVVEFLRYIQESSSSNSEKGYEILELNVSDGVLDKIWIREESGDFNANTLYDYNPDAIVGSGKTKYDSIGYENKIDLSETGVTEVYYVDACYIDGDSYVRLGINDDSNNCDILCSAPDSTNRGGEDFKINISIERPLREPHVNIVPVQKGSTPSGNSFLPGEVIPTSNERENDTYEGFRLVLSTEEGINRSIDIYKTGLISSRSSDTTDGCGV